MYYDVIHGKGVASTSGLRELGYPEVRLRLKPGDDLTAAESLLRTIGNYMIEQRISLRSGETFGFGSWTVQLLAERDDELWISEYTSSGDRYVDGASFALNLWGRQQMVCEKNEASCLRPAPTQLVVISDGVLEGDPIDGVRYSSPGHMSGWWITTDRYNNDPKTLKLVHVMHVLEKRPELGEILALPFGFRFDKSGTVTFDEHVANEIDE